MAFPYIFQSNWEDGAIGWDTEADTGSKLSIPHYTDLAKVAGLPAPYRGAYCMWIDLRSGDTNDHTLNEGDINLSANDNHWFRWYMYFSDDFTGTADDTVNVFELEATSTVEATVGFRIVAATNAINIGVGETAPTVFGSAGLPRGKWLLIEVQVNIDDGAGNDGDVTVYVDGAQHATIGSLDQGAITDGTLGIQDALATTTGHVLFDDFVHDDARIGGSMRFPQDQLITQSTHAFVGPGYLENITLLSSATADCVLELYDTDVATTDIGFLRARLANTAAAGSETVDPASTPIRFNRGCYVSLAGTADAGGPRAIAKIGAVSGYYSDGAIRAYANRRKIAPGNK